MRVAIADIGLAEWFWAGYLIEEYVSVFSGSATFLKAATKALQMGQESLLLPTAPR